MTIAWSAPVPGMYRIEVAVQTTRDASPIGVGFTQACLIASE
jgi:hypothetical protein